MKLANVSTDTLEKIKSVRWDRIIEKHEGPFVNGSQCTFTSKV